MSPTLSPTRVAVCIATLCFAISARAGEMREIGEIRRLTPSEAGEGRSVRLHAVVTYYNPVRHVDLAVQDSTGGIFIGKMQEAGDFEPGQEVEIEGVTYWETFMPMIDAKTIRVTGRGELPRPKTVTYAEVMSGNEIGQWVRISGVVRDVRIDPSQKPPRLLVEAASSGARFRAWMLDFEAADPERLVDAEVTLVGVPAALSNNDGKIFNFRLLMSRRDDISIATAPPLNPYEAVLLPLQNLRQCRPDNVVEHRVHVTGTVTGWQPGQWLALTDGAGALQMRTDQTTPALRPGDKVHVLGFPARGEYGAILEDAIFKPTGERAAEPTPEPVTASLALKNDSRLISIDATLLGMVQRADAFLLTLQADGTPFETNLAWSSPVPPWPGLQPGCQVRVTGICTVSAGDDVRYLRDLNPQSFRVALRNQADLTILKYAPWLTLNRAEIIMAALGAATLLLLWHYRSLREQIAARARAELELKQAHGELEARVEERSLQIEKEISARRVAEGALHERNRLAAEIHDSLQQGLTALGAQLAIANETIQSRPETARAGLAQARALVRHTQEEIRRTILNLRSQILERHALDGAFAELGRTLLADRPITFKVASDGEARNLPELVQDHLLRIGQEALTNSLKHAQPSRIDVRLAFRTKSVTLAVSDDGCGFCAEARAREDGHFGLVGMRERVSRLGGTFVLETSPGAGTKIAVVVPLESAAVMRD